MKGPHIQSSKYLLMHRASKCRSNPHATLCCIYASVCRPCPLIADGIAVLPCAALCPAFLFASSPKHNHRMCPSVQALPAYHRLFVAMQGWIVTPWSSANAAAEAPSHPHAEHSELSVSLHPAQVPSNPMRWHSEQISMILPAHMK